MKKEKGLISKTKDTIDTIKTFTGEDMTKTLQAVNDYVSSDLKETTASVNELCKKVTELSKSIKKLIPAALVCFIITTLLSVGGWIFVAVLLLAR